MKKSVLASKGGAAAFQISPDGAYLNGCGTIAEAFKMIEDAIVLSGANDDGRRLF
jgi:hypothetical protein